MLLVNIFLVCTSFLVEHFQQVNINGINDISSFPVVNAETIISIPSAENLPSTISDENPTRLGKSFKRFGASSSSSSSSNSLALVPIPTQDNIPAITPKPYDDSDTDDASCSCVDIIDGNYPDNLADNLVVHNSDSVDNDAIVDAEEENSDCECDDDTGHHYTSNASRSSSHSSGLRMKRGFGRGLSKLFSKGGRIAGKVKKKPSFKAPKRPKLTKNHTKPPKTIKTKTRKQQVSRRPTEVLVP